MPHDGACLSASLSPPLHIHTQNQDYRPTEEMAFDLEKIGSTDNFLNLFEIQTVFSMHKSLKHQSGPGEVFLQYFIGRILIYDLSVN